MAKACSAHFGDCKIFRAVSRCSCRFLFGAPVERSKDNFASNDSAVNVSSAMEDYWEEELSEDMEDTIMGED